MRKVKLSKFKRKLRVVGLSKMFAETMKWHQQHIIIGKPNSAVAGGQARAPLKSVAWTPLISNA